MDGYIKRRTDEYGLPDHRQVNSLIKEVNHATTHFSVSFLSLSNSSLEFSSSINSPSLFSNYILIIILNSLLKNNCYKLNYLLLLINKFLNKVLHEREKVQFRKDVRKKPKAFASFLRDHRA